MTIVLQIHGDAWFGPTVHDGRYVVNYDVDAAGGRGLVETSPDQAKALTFDDVGAAMKFIQQVSTVDPIRTDGRPNRPLTAFNIELVRKDEA